MKKILTWVLTPPYIVLFFSILLVFHPIQMIALLLGYRAHKWALDMMNFCLVQNFRTMGTTFDVSVSPKIPSDRPIIFVSNHQSMYDIPCMIWYLRRFHPKFIAKKELGRGIPSISFALRNMGSVLIERKNQSQAIPAIEAFGKKCSERNWAASIFPEGTRARDGAMKQFKPGGLITLMRAMPDAAIVPLALDGSWTLVRYNLWPVPWGTRVYLHALDPVEREADERVFVEKLEKIVRDEVERVRAL